MTSAAQTSRTRFWIVAVAPLIAGVLPSYLMGTLAVSMGEDIGYTAAILGILTAVRFFAAALGSAAMGRLAERVGPAHGLRAAALTIALATVVVAVLVRNVWLLGAVLAACGLALALVQPSADLWVARGIRADRQGFAFGVKQAAVPAAALLAGLAVPSVAETLGWRWVWALAGAAALAAAVSVPWRSTATAGGRARGERASPRLIPLAWFAACFGLGSVAVVNLTTFLVVGVVHDGLPEGTAGLLFALASVVGIAARMLFGRLADTTRGDLLLALAALQAVGAVLFVLLSLLGGAWFFLTAPLAFAIALGWPGVLMLAVVRSHKEQPAAATSIVNTGAFLGSIVGPITFGVIATRWSFAVGWWLTAACLLAAGGAALSGRAALSRGDARPQQLPAEPTSVGTVP